MGTHHEQSHPLESVKSLRKRGLSVSSKSTARFPSSRPIVLRACPKNGRHGNFVPVRGLKLKDFPVNGLDDRWRKLVLCIAQFVVRVKIEETVTQHMKTGPKSRKRARTCTGLTTSLREEYVVISIPAHAVGENVEVPHVVVEFFFDSDDGKNSISAKGLSLQRPRAAEPLAKLTCRACAHLQQRLRPLLDSSMVEDDGSPLTGEEEEAGKADVAEEIVALVSHPHGFSKRVSFGRCNGLETSSGPNNTWISSGRKPERQSTSKAGALELSEAPSWQLRNLATSALFGALRALSVLGRQWLSPVDRAATLARLLCCVPSCPGSSGGPVIVLAPRRPDPSVMSARIFVHVGTLPDSGVNVAVPLNARIVLPASRPRLQKENK